MVGLTLILVKFPQRPKIHIKFNWKLAASIVLFVYLTLLMYWIYNADNFVLENVSDILAVPWEFYPMFLGIIGVIVIPGIMFSLKKYWNNPVIIFVALLVSIFIAGRLLTFVNAESLFKAAIIEEEAKT